MSLTYNSKCDSSIHEGSYLSQRIQRQTMQKENALILTYLCNEIYFGNRWKAIICL